MTLTINIDLEKRCVECGGPGALANTLCMGCTGKAIRGGRMKSPAGRDVAARARKEIAMTKPRPAPTPPDR